MVENVFTVYEVPKNLKVKLILLLLSFRAKFVICRLTAVQMDDYDELKRFLLAQFKLMPKEYKARFVNASKTADETYTLFEAGCISCSYTTFEVDRPKAITSA